jgi:hypothetical protein
MAYRQNLSHNLDDGGHDELFLSISAVEMVTISSTTCVSVCLFMTPCVFLGMLYACNVRESNLEGLNVQAYRQTIRFGKLSSFYLADWKADR